MKTGMAADQQRAGGATEGRLALEVVPAGTAPGPRDCPRYETCNANVCPLDPKWRKAVHLSGEQVCFYLRASGKAGAAERFAGDPAFLACLAALPEVTARHRDIRVRVEKAARSPFQGQHLIRQRSGAGEIGVAPMPAPDAP